jgi:hypothetical protein
MDLIADNRRDFMQYCKNCFVSKVSPTTGTTSVFRIEESEDGERVVLHKVSPDKGIATRRMSTWQQVLEDHTFVPERVGFSSFEGTLIYVSRMPVRTYRKGFCKELFQWDILNIDLWLKKQPLRVADASVALAAYLPKYEKFSTLYNKLQEGKVIGGAISSTLGLYADEGYENTILAYKGRMVGFVTDKVATVTQASHVFADRWGTELGLEVRTVGK